ncbi:MAG: hypothetical protein R6X18_13290 [Chloroflexota bacterium]
MQAPTEFSGLTMPVFTAFGWAEEENALKFALSQVEQYVDALYLQLPPAVRDEFPSHGLSFENQNAYLATGDAFDSEAYVAFNARPMSLEILLGIVGKTALSKGLAVINKNPTVAHHTITQLEPSWTLRVQQMQIDTETGERAHHLDLYKESVGDFTEEQARDIFERAAYLNEEEKWVTPVYLSLRMPSERVAAMGMAIVPASAELVVALAPVLQLFTGRKPKKSRATKPSAKSKAVRPVVEPGDETPGEPTITASVKAMADGFTYVAELMPLHIRRGFVNLTPAHWPFFATGTRSETRQVTVVFGGRQDRSSTVWRLQPDDQARLVLGRQVHDWLEENFSASDSIRVNVRRLDNDEIRVTLEPVL